MPGYFFRYDRALSPLRFSREAWGFPVPVPAHISSHGFSIFFERDNAASSGSLSPYRHVQSFRAGAFTSRKLGVILSRPGGEVGRYAYRSSLRNWQYRGNGSDDVALLPFATVSRYGRLRRPRISALVFYHTICTPCRLAAQDELPSIYQWLRLWGPSGPRRQRPKDRIGRNSVSL